MRLASNSPPKFFGQRPPDPPDLLKPSLEGHHYKFTLLIPITEQVPAKDEAPKPVFTEEDLEELKGLFQRDFGGFREPSIITGQWRDDEKDEIVVNQNARYEVYSSQIPRALGYFSELKARLIDYSKKRVFQKDILIEVQEVTVVSRSLNIEGVQY